MTSTLAPARPQHLPVPELVAPAGTWRRFLTAVPAHPLGPDPADELTAVRSAGRARRLLPAAVHDGLADFAEDSGQAGALLLRGLPIGPIPRTPALPTDASGTDGTTEHLLLTVARSLGHPVGYLAEHGGRIVQNLLPTRDGADRQISTSSAVELEFHTETAFHPFKPRYLLLLCLRGDPAAQTLLASIHEVLPHLPAAVRDVLAQPRFRTGVDESFTHHRPGPLGDPMPVLSGHPDRPTLTFDADLMIGLDPDASEALDVLGRVARDLRIGVTLTPGDLLVVDNHACIHGRTAFGARYDGTDRWLQRSFVVSDLAPSAASRLGHRITTSFD